MQITRKIIWPYFSANVGGVVACNVLPGITDFWGTGLLDSGSGANVTVVAFIL